MTAKVQPALDKLKSMGVRMTPQRHAILSYLMDSMSHPSADEIYKALERDYPSMSVATIYNNLKLFVEAGLVRELTYGDDSSRFDANMTDHYHMMCEQCGTIVDFEYPQLHEVELEAARQTGFVLKGHRMEVYGLCSDCSQSQSST